MRRVYLAALQSTEQRVPVGGGWCLYARLDVRVESHFIPGCHFEAEMEPSVMWSTEHQCCFWSLNEFFYFGGFPLPAFVQVLMAIILIGFYFHSLTFL